MANVAKRVEETIAPDWVLLPDFPPSLQMDEYSCGAQSAFVVLWYFRRLYREVLPIS